MEFRYNRWADCWEIVDFEGCEVMDIKVADVKEIASHVMGEIDENDIDYTVIECVIYDIDEMIHDKIDYWPWNIENYIAFYSWVESLSYTLE